MERGERADASRGKLGSKGWGRAVRDMDRPSFANRLGAWRLAVHFPSVTDPARIALADTGRHAEPLAFADQNLRVTALREAYDVRCHGVQYGLDVSRR